MHGIDSFRATFCSNVVQTVLIVDDQVVGVVVEMNGGGVDCDVIIVAEKLGHFFQRNAVRLWQNKPSPNGTNTADDNKDTILR